MSAPRRIEVVDNGLVVDYKDGSSGGLELVMDDGTLQIGTYWNNEGNPFYPTPEIALDIACRLIKWANSSEARQ